MNKNLTKKRQKALLDIQLASSIKKFKNEDALDNYEKENEKNTPENEEDTQNEDSGLSEYEKMIKKKRQERLAFLESLKIEEVKKEFIGGVKGARPKRIFKRKPPPIPRQKSLRLAQMQNKANETAHMPPLSDICKNELLHEPKPSVYPFQDARCDIKDGMSLDEMNISFAPLDPDCKTFSYKNYLHHFKKMKIPPNGIAKIGERKITSLTIHPTLEKIFIAAGDSVGKIGFWDVETPDNEGLYLFEPHVNLVSCLSFSLTNQNQLLSSSYDGNFTCGDIEKKIFTKIYESKDKLTYFDFISPTTFLTSQDNGYVAILDRRTEKKKVIKKHQSHQCHLKTVSVHPDKNHFITAGRNGIVSLWDLRMLKKSSMHDILLEKSVTSAFFSPVTGNSILTLSLDKNIRIFDSTNLTKKINLKKTIKHNLYSTRWLTQFKACWLPNNEEVFSVGSVDYPRRIEIYGVNGKIVHSFLDENLTTITSLHHFHPYQPILIGGNSSGKIYLFHKED